MKRFLVLLVSFFISLKPCLALDLEFQEIAHLEIEEVSEEVGVVSTLAKQFRLIVHHDPNYIPAENLESFDAGSSPVLSSLQIIRRDLSRKTKNPKNITSDFSFELENNSSESEDYNGFLMTSYLSNEQIIKKASRLNFVVDIFNYLDDQQDIDTNNLVTRINAKYDIESLVLDFSSISLNGSELHFSSLNPESKKAKIISDEYLVKANLESPISLSDSIKNIKFKTESEIGNKIASKIKKDGSKGKQSTRLIPQVSEDGITITNTAEDFYEVQIPVSFKSKNSLSLKEMQAIEDFDLVIMPVFLDIKTSDKRDININGILRDTVGIFFDNGD